MLEISLGCASGRTFEVRPVAVRAQGRGRLLGSRSRKEKTGRGGERGGRSGIRLLAAFPDTRSRGREGEAKNLKTTGQGMPGFGRGGASSSGGRMVRRARMPRRGDGGADALEAALYARPVRSEAQADCGSAIRSEVDELCRSIGPDSGHSAAFFPSRLSVRRLKCRACVKARGGAGFERIVP